MWLIREKWQRGMKQPLASRRRTRLTEDQFVQEDSRNSYSCQRLSPKDPRRRLRRMELKPEQSSSLGLKSCVSFTYFLFFSSVWGKRTVRTTNSSYIVTRACRVAEQGVGAACCIGTLSWLERAWVGHESPSTTL
jgi:hypothetical protein